MLREVKKCVQGYTVSNLEISNLNKPARLQKFLLINQHTILPLKTSLSL